MRRTLGLFTAALFLAGAVLGCSPATSSRPAQPGPPSNPGMGGGMRGPGADRMKQEMEKHKGSEAAKDKDKEKDKDKDKDKDKP
jgi:hypothetical protein